MRSRYLLIVVVLVILAFGVGRLSAAVGTFDSPDVPANTLSYTLDDIWNRLDSGADGAQSTFTEPGVAPGTGTMHTLNETMVKTPAKDDTNGAATGDVANGKTFWGLNVAGGEWGLRTGTANVCTSPAPVPKTGQTTCYDAGGTVRACANTGEDGEHQKGVAWPVPRFTKPGDGTVTDNLTGLMWLQDANCISTQHATYNFDNDGTVGDGRVTWQNALDFVAGINAGTYANCGAGQTDWRLPNVREMQSLVHYGVWSPAVPNTNGPWGTGLGKWTAGDPFDNVQSFYYWSSTTSAGGPGYAWAVRLDAGRVTGDNKGFPYYVWPVRGGQ